MLCLVCNVPTTTTQKRDKPENWSPRERAAITFCMSTAIKLLINCNSHNSLAKDKITLSTSVAALQRIASHLDRVKVANLPRLTKRMTINLFCDVHGKFIGSHWICLLLIKIQQGKQVGRQKRICRKMYKDVHYLSQTKHHQLSPVSSSLLHSFDRLIVFRKLKLSAGRENEYVNVYGF